MAFVTPSRGEGRLVIKKAKIHNPMTKMGKNLYAFQKKKETRRNEML